MKYLRLTLLLLLICSFGFAQNNTTSKETEGTEATWQAGIFGGVSLPLGQYKKLPEKAKLGFTGGLFADRYFKNSRLGIGVDIRFLEHGLSKFDSIKFANGSIYRSALGSSNALGKQHFSYTAFTVGPTYKLVDAPKGQIEAFIRGGIVLQHFAVYQKTLTYTPGGGAATNFVVGQAANDKSLPSWAGLGGFRFTRNLSTNWGIFLQTDYIRTFGKSWGKDNNRFTYESHNQLKPINSSTTIADPIGDGIYDAPSFDNTAAANMQAVNITIGIKYTFRNHKTEQDPDKAPIVITKDIQVRVKDKQTGQVIENATVNIARSDKTYTSNSNSSGDAQRVKKALEAKYTISGNKNGIQSTMAEVTAADFANNPGPVIYKEIYLDDIRFTLKGTTISCDNGKPLAGIITSLRNTKTNEVTNYTSDSSGQFSYQLEPNTDYSVVGNQKGKFSQTELVTTNGLTRSATLYVSLNLKLCDIAKDKVFELKNILYDFDMDNIRPDAAVILNNVITILQQNPTLEIELSSHTDSRGKDLYNMDLSDRRAKSAVAYLIAKGIDSKRLEAKGYGETKLLNKCSNGVACTEEEHQANRRTEIKVLKY